MDDHTDLAVPGRVARLGEYFALRQAVGPDWHRFGDLLAPSTLGQRVAATRFAIAGYSGSDPADVPVRVAASSLQMAIAARLISPALGSFAVLQAVPLLTSGCLRWRTAGHSVQFGATTLEWRAVDGAAEAARVIDASLLDGALGPLIDWMHAQVSLSPQVMWGNVISSANGAVTVLGISDSSMVAAGHRLVNALAGTGALHGSAATGGNVFVRRSCCLFYQAPHGGLCGDCVLQRTTPSR